MGGLFLLLLPFHRNWEQNTLQYFVPLFTLLYINISFSSLVNKCKLTHLLFSLNLVLSTIYSVFVGNLYDRLWIYDSWLVCLWCVWWIVSVGFVSVLMMGVCLVFVQLEWRKGKVNPFVSSIRAKLRPRGVMSFNIVNDKDGLPRVILTEPTGSSAEVWFKFWSFFLVFALLCGLIGTFFRSLELGFGFDWISNGDDEGNCVWKWVDVEMILICDVCMLLWKFWWWNSVELENLSSWPQFILKLGLYVVGLYAFNLFSRLELKGYFLSWWACWLISCKEV